MGGTAVDAPAPEPPSALQDLPIVSDAGFTHPGVFVGLEELNASRQHVLAGENPWASLFEQLKSSDYATRPAQDFTQFVSADNEFELCNPDDPAGCMSRCGPNNDPDYGCTEQLEDARAVYGQSLLWWYTADPVYANRAIAILNAYASHFKGHTGSNGPLMAAWVSELMLRGAEIIRYTYEPAEGETAFDVAGFSRMLKSAFVERLTSFNFDDHIGNWKLSAADGLVNLGVFLDDRELYELGIDMWRERVPSYIYLSSDGPLPIPPADSIKHRDAIELSCRWLDQKAPACETSPRTDPHATFQNGQSEETCRDLNHASMGLAGVINVAETAYQQGDDLYQEQQERIMTGVSYAVQISLTYYSEPGGWPRDFCSNTAPHSRDVRLASLPADVVYNAYAIRKGAKFETIHIPGYAQTYPGNDPVAAYIALRRTEDAPVQSTSAWENLTHHLAGAASGTATRNSPLPTPTTPAAPSASNETPTLPPLLWAYIAALAFGVSVATTLLTLWFVKRSRRQARPPH